VSDGASVRTFLRRDERSRTAPRWAPGEAALALTILAVFALLALAPGAVSSADGLRSGSAALAPPGAGHPLGTDALGRDVWARLAFGAHTSLAVGALATAVALGTGTLVGATASLLGGWWDELLMRGAEVADAVPALLLALLLVAVLGPGLVPVVLVIGLTGWLAIARVVRAELRRARGAPHVIAARALGAGPARLAVRHVAPGVLGPVLALLPFRLEGAIVVEAGLSFLGVEDVGRPSWGAMLRDAQPLLPDAWWLAAAPAIALALLVFALGLAADLLQHASDPRLRS
jgi:peptide/nickel transport system permease protein